MESTRALGVEAPHQEEGRVVKDVGAKIPHGEFLVYYSTSPDNVRCDPDGNAPNGTNEAGRLFESFDHARAYAAKKANSARLIGAGVYDDRWRILVQFASEEALRRETKKRQPGRLLLWSTALLFIGAMLLWWEIRSGWTAIVGFLIGSRFLLSGTLKMADTIRAARLSRKGTIENRQL
jgi:hypothetical protein